MKEKQDDYVEEKANNFLLKCPGILFMYSEGIKKFLKDFIRSIIKDCQPKVSRELVIDVLAKEFRESSPIGTWLIPWLKEIGVKVEES